MRITARLSGGECRTSFCYVGKSCKKISTELYLKGWAGSDMCLILTFKLIFLSDLHSLCFALTDKAQGLGISKP